MTNQCQIGTAATILCQIKTTYHLQPRKPSEEQRANSPGLYKTSVDTAPGNFHSSDLSSQELSIGLRVTVIEGTSG